jgi:hypothetical protein
MGARPEGPANSSARGRDAESTLAERVPQRSHDEEVKRRDAIKQTVRVRAARGLFEHPRGVLSAKAAAGVRGLPKRSRIVVAASYLATRIADESQLRTRPPTSWRVPGAAVKFSSSGSRGGP